MKSFQPLFLRVFFQSLLILELDSVSLDLLFLFPQMPEACVCLSFYFLSIVQSEWLKPSFLFSHSLILFSVISASLLSSSIELKSFYYVFLFIFSIIWGRASTLIHWYFPFLPSPMPATAERPKPGAENLIRCPIWVARAQLFKPSLLSSGVCNEQISGESGAEAGN